MSLNYWAVLVSGIAYMALGAIWYSSAICGNLWLKGIGKTKEQVAADAKSINYLLALIFSLLAAYGIARVMQWYGGQGIRDGIVVSLLAGVCFVLATMGVNDLFESRPKSLTVTNILYHIVVFVIMGIIIGVWR